MFKIGDKVKVICEDSILEKGSTFIIKKIGIWNGEPLYMDINKSRCAGVIASEIILVKEEVEDNKMTKTFKEVIADIKEGEVWESKLFFIKEINGNTRIETKSYEFQQGDYDLFFDNNCKEFTLQRTKVSFTEAFKAYEEGKEIESCETSRNWGKDMACFDSFTMDEIRNQWYIN